MFDNDTLHSNTLEIEVIGGIINNPHVFPEIDSFIDVEDFYSKENYAIFFALTQVLPDYIASKKKVNAAILHTKTLSCNFTFKGGLDLLEYIRELSFSTASFQDTIKAAQSLKKVSYKRDMTKALREAAKFVSESDSIDQINSHVYEKVTGVEHLYTSSNNPINLTSGIVEMLKDRANNPVDFMGVPWPRQYKYVNKIMGGLRIGHISFVAARLKQGKSTFLADVAYGVAEEGTKVLCLDTEMLSEELQFRMAAAATGINCTKLETGKWNTDAKLVQQFRDSEQQLSRVLPIYHLYTPMTKVEDLCSIIRRFKHSMCDKDENFLVLYDYMQLTGEQTSNHNPAWQILGEKTARLKACCAEMGAACLGAVQINRMGETKNRKSGQIERSLSVIAGSDKISQLADKVFWWGKKAQDEIHSDNIDGQGDYGTHLLMPLASRHQGEDALGFDDVRRRIMADGSEIDQPFYFNFDVKNFKVTEMETVDQIIAKSRNRRSRNDSDNPQNQERDGSVELQEYSNE